MVKSFYVVSTEYRKYSSKVEFSVVPFGQPVFGSSDIGQISETVMNHNLEVEDFINSESLAFPVTVCYYHFCEITNLD